MRAPQPKIQGILLAFLGFAFFATHDALIKTLGGTYSVFQIIFFTTLLSFVPMTVVMLADRKVDNFLPHHPWLILLRSGLMIAAMSGTFYAFANLPMAEVYSILFTVPLFITVLSVPLLGETVRAQRWAAVGIGLVGVIVVLRPGSTELTLAHGAALIGAFSGALSNILVRKVGKSERSAVMILYPMLLSVIAMAAVMPQVYVPPTLGHLGMMAAVAILSVIAQHMIIAAYRAAPAALVAPSQYSQIIWATLFGALFFNETPDIYVGIGASIIILSGVFVVWRESREDVSDRNPVLRTPNMRVDTGPSTRPKPLTPEGMPPAPGAHQAASGSEV